ncbi:hypothetical protein BD626DRAFT_177187 [Schizophyllum amplum]|uniref:Uncharacterized protein n=1 Tax=Schizophyllum amplum TaxID=97359 RepID=A0A550C262_9AGAR|nr:hypothetical protein BD626DRAFT_177187 [Auriculariopsis ampla]
MNILLPFDVHSMPNPMETSFLQTRYLDLQLHFEASLLLFTEHWRSTICQVHVPGRPLPGRLSLTRPPPPSTHTALLPYGFRPHPSPNHNHPHAALRIWLPYSVYLHTLALSYVHVLIFLQSRPCPSPRDPLCVIFSPPDGLSCSTVVLTSRAQPGSWLAPSVSVGPQASRHHIHSHGRTQCDEEPMYKQCTSAYHTLVQCYKHP